MREALKQQVALVGVLLSICVNAHAELAEMSDEQLSEVSGQGVIAVDNATLGTQDFLRINLGLVGEFQANVDRFDLGNIAQTGETATSDVLINQLSFGSIATATQNQSLGGQTFAEGEIIPFEFLDPYFEIVQDNGELVGFRIGFDQARGVLGADIQSLSGNLEVGIDDGSGVITPAQLLDANGQIDTTRAINIGLASATTDCAAGINCFPLSNLGSVDIGEVDATTGAINFANDLFFSFQTQDVTFQAGDGSVITAGPGAFVNIPTATTVTLDQLQQGVARPRVEYIDRGIGLF